MSLHQHHTRTFTTFLIKHVEHGPQGPVRAPGPGPGPGPGFCCIAVLTPAARRPAQELPRPRVPYKVLPLAFFSILCHLLIQVWSPRLCWRCWVEYREGGGADKELWMRMESETRTGWMMAAVKAGPGVRLPQLSLHAAEF